MHVRHLERLVVLLNAVAASLALSLASASLLGCDGQAAPQKRFMVAQSAHAAVPATICGANDAPLPTQATITALGPPLSEARFRLSEPLSEFRVGLLNRFRLPRDAATEVWERTWGQGRCRLTIWSARPDGAGEWNAVARLRWSEGDEF